MKCKLGISRHTITNVDEGEAIILEKKGIRKERGIWYCINISQLKELSDIEYEIPIYYPVKKSIKEMIEKRKMAAVKGLNGILPKNATEMIIKKMYKRNEMCMCTEETKCSLCVYACCNMAIGFNCVCIQGTRCEIHGYKCNGGHD